MSAHESATFHYLLVYFTPEHQRKLVLSLNVTAQCDMAWHLVHMAVEVEHLHSGPGAIAWILVCERAHSVTPFALDVSPNKINISFLRRERGHVLVQQAGRAVAHTSRASSHSFR